MTTFDSHLLRTFLAVADAGSVTGGARRVGRSQSAVSIQLGQLENLVGGPVFERHSRGVKVNTRGAALLSVARDVVGALDCGLAEIRGGGMRGRLRIGVPDEHGRELMSRLVAGFARDNPNVELFVHCGLSAGFSDELASGALDLAVHEVEYVGPGMTVLREEPICWTGSRAHRVHERDPLPVALFDQACWWRDVSLRALDNAGRPYRIVYTSESMTGVAAAIEAGIAIGTLGQSFVTDDFMVLEQVIGLPKLPASKLVLESRPGADDALSDAMAEAARRAYAF